MSNTEILLLVALVGVATGVISFRVGHSRGVQLGGAPGAGYQPVRGPVIEPSRAAAALLTSRYIGADTRGA